MSAGRFKDLLLEHPVCFCSAEGSSQAVGGDTPVGAVYPNEPVCDVGRGARSASFEGVNDNM